MSEIKQLSAEQQVYREGLLTIYDGMKHLTTLSTGSIVILTTFLEKLFANPKAPQILIVAIGLLFANILTSVWTLLGISTLLQDIEPDKTEEKRFQRTFVISIFSFIGGIATVALFAIINLW